MRRAIRKGCAATCLSLLTAAVIGGGAASAQAEPCANEALREAQHSTALPDCRGYELVSPPAKNGGDVRAESSKVQVAPDGSAVVYSSYVPFGDVVGSSLETTYLSQRAAGADSGWTTHAISPREEALSYKATTFNEISDFQAVFTPDLNRGVYRSWRPLTDAPEVDNTSNLYELGGLRSGLQSTLLLTDAYAPFPPPSEFGIYRPEAVGASTDLSHVIFESRAPLTAPNPSHAIKLYESVDGSVRLAGVLPNGTPATSSQAGFGALAFNLYPAPRSISVDGRRVFFNDPTTEKIYLREDGTATVQLNASEKEPPGSPQPATFWTASADGSRAFFTTGESLVESDPGGTDLYMYEAEKPAGERLTRLSVDGEPGDGTGAGVTTVLGASEDGRYVYFTSAGQLVSGKPLGVGSGLYAWHDGDISYIGHFLDSLETGYNAPLTSFGFTNAKIASRVTANGRHLLFMTRGDVGFKGQGGFAGYDHGHGCTYDISGGGPCRELYVYNADDDRLQCASCNPSGATATADAFDNVRQGFGVTTWHLSQALSEDGERVFFNTAEALVPEDTNGKTDAYEFDVPSGTVHLISDGVDHSNSYFLGASKSGDDVFFVTRARLVGWDTDDSYDLYDAPVDGGLPEPVPSPAACAGAACRAQPAPAPAALTPASSTFHGPGNRGVQAGCPRGKREVHRRGKVSCVKKHREHKRHAKHGRRAGR